MSYRAILLAEPSILHATGGRLATQTDILQLLATGSKKIIQVSGNAKMRCLDSPRSIMHTMESTSAVRCSKFLIVLALHTRSVLVYTIKLQSLITTIFSFSSVTSHAIMPRIMALRYKNWLACTKWNIRSNFRGVSGGSSGSLSYLLSLHNNS